MSLEEGHRYDKGLDKSSETEISDWNKIPGMIKSLDRSNETNICHCNRITGMIKV